MANFISDDLAKVGIKVTLVPVEFNTLITNISDDFRTMPILLGLQSGVPPDPAMGQNVWRSSGRTHYGTQPAEARDAARKRRSISSWIRWSPPRICRAQAAWTEDPEHRQRAVLVYLAADHV